MSDDIHLLKAHIHDLQVENRRLTDEKVMLAKTVTALQNEVFTLRSKIAADRCSFIFPILVDGEMHQCILAHGHTESHCWRPL